VLQLQAHGEVGLPFIESKRIRFVASPSRYTTPSDPARGARGHLESRDGISTSSTAS